VAMGGVKPRWGPRRTGSSCRRGGPPPVQATSFVERRQASRSAASSPDQGRARLMTTRSAPHTARHRSTCSGSTACAVLRGVHVVSMIALTTLPLLLAERRAAHRAERGPSCLSSIATASAPGACRLITRIRWVTSFRVIDFSRDTGPSKLSTRGDDSGAGRGSSLPWAARARSPAARLEQ
jgi:hypothetical protein